jgi:porphobilinogen deaminase
MSETFRNASKQDYRRAEAERPTHEQINLGCMQRIADATELMAKDRSDLVKENKWLASSRKHFRDDCEFLRRQVAAQKGLVTKLKKQLANQAGQQVRVAEMEATMETLRQAGNRVIYYGRDPEEWQAAVISALTPNTN